jgi:hypothetical protein
VGCRIEEAKHRPLNGGPVEGGAAVQMTAEAAQCYNCGHPISGKFCSECGQRFQPPVVPLWDVAVDILGNFVTFDSKAVRSLRPLLFRPGLLTREFSAGRQVAYLPPSRLYAFVSVYFWLLVRRFDPITVDTFRQNVGDQASPLHTLTAAQVVAMNERISNNLPLLMLGIIPLFALLMKLLYVRQKVYYTEHLTFAFHFFSFIYLILTPAVVTANPRLYYGVLLGIAPLYLFVAVRVAYRQGLGSSLIKTLLLSAGFLALLLLWVLLIAVTGLRR